MVWQSHIRTRPSLLAQCTFHSGTLPLGNFANRLPLTLFKQHVNELTMGTPAEKSNINITNISINLCLKYRLHQILKKKKRIHVWRALYSYPTSSQISSPQDLYSLEKEMATTPVFLPGESHGQRSLGRLQSMGSQESETT